jgi:hypothetical protein
MVCHQIRLMHHQNLAVHVEESAWHLVMKVEESLIER